MLNTYGKEQTYIQVGAFVRDITFTYLQWRTGIGFAKGFDYHDQLGRSYPDIGKKHFGLPSPAETLINLGRIFGIVKKSGYGEKGCLCLGTYFEQYVL